MGSQCQRLGASVIRCHYWGCRHKFEMGGTSCRRVYGGRPYDSSGRSRWHCNGHRSRSYAWVAIVAARWSDAEAVCRAPVLALVEMSFHVPSSTEGFAARWTSVGTAVDVSVMLQWTGMFEDLSALVACVPSHAIGCNGESLGYRVYK